MTSVLFVHIQTFHAKVTIPVALACLKQGWGVTFQVNRPVVFGHSFGFSNEIVGKNPTAVNVLNPEAFDYMADLIGLGDEWRAARKKVKFTLIGTIRPERYDVVIGTTKGMDMLSRISKKNIPTFALGYHHLPVFLRVNGPLPDNHDLQVQRSVFFSDNAFSKQHDFRQVIVGSNSVRLNAFTYLDPVYARCLTEYEQTPQVLVFYPGGYRGVVSMQGDDRRTCYIAQKALLKQICLPLLAEGLTPVIKVHPLRAQYHDINDLEILAREVEQENGASEGSIRLIGPKAWFWDEAHRSRFILNFASTSIYELWTAGIKKMHVWNFSHKSTGRNQKYTNLSGCLLQSYDEYRTVVTAPEKYTPKLDDLSIQVYNAYHSLFRGNAVAQIMDDVCSVLD